MPHIAPIAERVGVSPMAQCPFCELYAEVKRIGKLLVVGCHHAAAEPQREGGNLFIVFSDSIQD